MINYRKCFLRKRNGKVIREATTWLPEKMVERGTFIHLKKHDGEAEDGWEIVSVSEEIFEKLD